MSSKWSTAAVTGASSGIGEQFCRQLAEAGVDLVVIARDVPRLRLLAAELTEAHGVTVEVLGADLSAPVARAAVERRLGDDTAPVDLLVNNAGFGTGGRFDELPVAREDQQIQLNVVALMRLTSAVAAGMVARGHGNIVNVSSIAGLQPTPGSATYGATKAFVSSFSASVHDDLAGTGVAVTDVVVGLTRTAFHSRPDVAAPTGLPEAAWLSASQVAREALLAAYADRARAVPGSSYRALLAARSVVPTGSVRWLSTRLRRAARSS